jgi:hypothetical protein
MQCLSNRLPSALAYAAKKRSTITLLSISTNEVASALCLRNANYLGRLHSKPRHGLWGIRSDKETRKKSSERCHQLKWPLVPVPTAVRLSASGVGGLFHSLQRRDRWHHWL